MLQQFTLITPVWGKSHTKLFIDVGIPSLLASDNIPHLARVTKVIYYIYTTHNEEQDLQESAAIKRLKDLITVHIIVFDEKIINNHIAMTWCHKQGIEKAISANSYAVFIPPDCIWSSQSMLSMYKIVAKGYKIIHISGIRVLKELFYPTVKDRYDDIIDISSRELVSIGLKYLHPITNSHFYDEKGGGLMPANLLWSVGNSGILARNFHLHPLLVNCSILGASLSTSFNSTIDDDLALGFNAQINEEYVVTDSDELVTFEISPSKHNVMAAYKKSNIKDVAAWAKYSTNSKHRTFVKEHIRLHSDAIDREVWDSVEKSSNIVIDATLELLARKPTFIEDFKSIRSLVLKAYSGKISKFIIGGISRFLMICAKSLDKFLSSKNGLYPWHWCYIFQNDVAEPFIHNIQKMNGKILFCDDKRLPLLDSIERKLSQSSKLKFETFDLNLFYEHPDCFIKNFNELFDYIVIRDEIFSKFTTEHWLYLSKLLNNDGQIVCNAKYLTDLSNLSVYLPQELCLVEEFEFGNLGAIFSMRCKQIAIKQLNKINLLRYSIVYNSLKLSLFPVYLIASPTISCISYIYKKIDNGDNWFEKSLIYSKKPA